MKRETVGKIASNLLSKAPDSRDPIEIEREIHREYEFEVFKCVEEAKKTHEDSFYVIVITKKEPLMENVIRHYYFARTSCPTPDYDQTVYRYDHIKNVLEFLWVVPSKDTCLLFIENKEKIVPQEWGLLQNILKFKDGTLFKLCKKLNGEQQDSSLLEE